MSFLDLLCCALGGVILLSLMMIASMRQTASQTLDYTYFIADTEIWIDIHADLQTLLLGSQAQAVGADKKALFEGADPDLAELASTLEELRDQGVDWREVIKAQYQVKQHLYFYPLDPNQQPAPAASDRWEPALRADVRTLGANRVDEIGTVYYYQSPIDASQIGYLPVDSATGEKFRYYFKCDTSMWVFRAPRGRYFVEIFLPNARNALRNAAADKATSITNDLVNLRMPPGRAGESAGSYEKLLDPLIARVQLLGSGLGGQLILQTHPTLPDFIATDNSASPFDDVDPLGERVDDWRSKIDGYSPTNNKAAQKLRKDLSRMRKPDQYIPLYQRYDLASQPTNVDVLPDDAAQFLAILAPPSSEAWRIPYPVLYLRAIKGEPFAPEARFPLLEREGRRLGVHHQIENYEYYLPGVMVTRGR